MKIAVNTLFLIPGEVGGSETYLCETLGAMTRQHPEIELALVTNRENDALLRKLFGGFPQCTLHRLPVRAVNRYARIIAEQIWLPKIISRIKPDWLWSPGYTMPYWVPCRQVVSILDMQYRSHPDDLTPLARWTTHALVKMAARRADRIIAISEFSKREIVKHTGCPEDRIVVTPLGVDPGFGEALQPATAELQPYILSVANSYPHENLHRLVEAFGQLVDQIPHQLVLVGRPRLGEPQLARAIEQVPGDRIQRMAGLSREELITLYRAADLFVFPSLYEGFGLPVLEAMMAGVPVLTAREGSIPEIGGDDVVYADGRDSADLAGKMKSILAWRAEDRDLVIQRARQRAGQFTWPSTAKTTVEVFVRGR